jgi:hypothetical protein
MQHIEAEKLYTNGQYRFEYVSKFMDFGKQDQIIQGEGKGIVH